MCLKFGLKIWIPVCRSHWKVRQSFTVSQFLECLLLEDDRMLFQADFFFLITNSLSHERICFQIGFVFKKYSLY